MMRQNSRENQQDLDAWLYIQNLLELLGTDGMSSEDSEWEDKRRLEKTYRVNVLHARRAECDQLMIALDENHLMKRFAEGRPGRLPVPRTREAGQESERSPPLGWPRDLYDEEWFNAQSDAVQSAVSTAAFEWVDVVF